MRGEKPKIQKRMVTAQEAARMYSVAPGTLSNWRSAKNRGPRYFVQGRMVRYDIEDLEAFFKANPVLTVDSIREEMMQ